MRTQVKYVCTFLLAISAGAVVVTAQDTNATQLISAKAREAMMAGIAASNNPYDTEAGGKFKEQLDALNKVIYANQANLEAAFRLIRESKEADIAEFLGSWGVAGATDPKLVDHILEMVSDKDPKVRRAAVSALTPYRKRQFASRTLGRISPPKLSFEEHDNPFAVLEIRDQKVRRVLLRRMQQEGDGDTKRTLVWSLAYSQRLDTEVTSEFIRILQTDDNVATQQAVIRALCEGDWDGKGVDEILNLLQKSNDVGLREFIVTQLGLVGGRRYPQEIKRKIIDSYFLILKSEPNESVRRSAASGLYWLWPEPGKTPASKKKEIFDLLNNEKSQRVRDELTKLLGLEKAE